MSERCAFIDADKATTPMNFQCARLGVSTSTFHAWRHRQAHPPLKMRADTELTATIRAVDTRASPVARPMVALAGGPVRRRLMTSCTASSDPVDPTGCGSATSLNIPPRRDGCIWPP